MRPDDGVMRIVCGGGVLVTAVMLLFPLPPPLAQLAAFLLLAVWPAVTWFWWWRGRVWGAVVTAAAAPLLVNGLLALLLHYLPGPMPERVYLLLVTAVALGPLWPARRRPWPFRLHLTRKQAGMLALLLLVTAGLRVVNLGYGEFQGDEGVIMVRAAAAIEGDDGELWLHQKGPLEILLPLGMWQLGGALNEAGARLPFAWAALWAVGAVALLARRCFGDRAGWGAGFLFAIVGFGAAFGRIVQYQSLVMLWGTLAVGHMADYARRGEGRALRLAAVFLAGGLLAHYDAVLVAPALLWLLLRRWRREGVHWRRVMGAAALGGGLLAIFYLPFVANPNFAHTGSYLLQGRLGVSEETGPLSWSGPAVWRMVTLYNSLYFVVGLALLGGVGVWGEGRRDGMKTAVLLFLVPLLFYLFIVADPRTHVYTFFPGAVLLAAAGIGYLTRHSRGRWRYALGAVLLIWWVVSFWYVVLIFVDHTPERVRTWAENRPRFYPTTWEAPPLYGLFGFPHQTGWRAVPEFISADDLPYASNEEPEVTHWYMAQAPRTGCADYETFVLTTLTQDPVPYDEAAVAALPPRQVVTVNGRPALQILGGAETGGAPVEATGKRLWRAPWQVAPPNRGGETAVTYTLGDAAQLVGYDLDESRAYPGGKVVVTLYWRALRPFRRNYQVFTHLYDGQMRAQHDGAPACNLMPTSRWEPGRLIRDPHIIDIPAETPPGEYPLQVGMYGLLSGERLWVKEIGADAIPLLSLQIEE